MSFFRFVPQMTQSRAKKIYAITNALYFLGCGSMFIYTLRIVKKTRDLNFGKKDGDQGEA